MDFALQDRDREIVAFSNLASERPQGGEIQLESCLSGNCKSRHLRHRRGVAKGPQAHDNCLRGHWLPEPSLDPEAAALA